MVVYLIGSNYCFHQLLEEDVELLFCGLYFSLHRYWEFHNLQDPCLRKVLICFQESTLDAFDF